MDESSLNISAFLCFLLTIGILKFLRQIIAKMSKDTPHINVCFWNANGIYGKENAIRNFLLERDIDIMLLADIQLKAEHNFNITDYEFYKTTQPDVTAITGGTAVLIKSHIQHRVVEPYARKNMQATAITIELDKKNLTFAAVSWQPLLDYQLIEHQLAYLFHTLGACFFAAGGYNAMHTRWGSTSIDMWGTKLNNVILDAENGLDLVSTITANNYYQAVDDIKDFAVIKGIDKQSIGVRLCAVFAADSPVLYTF